jgi:hypothetical protein
MIGGGEMPAGSAKTKSAEGGGAGGNNSHGSLRISRQKQNRHIKGTKENLRYTEQMSLKGDFKPSRLSGDLNFAQKLVRQYAGKGIITKKGMHLEEDVETKKVIGKYWAWKANRWVKTKWIRIKYSATGAHVFPIHGGRKK